MRTRLSSKGQIVIPGAVRHAHGWIPGAEFSVEDLGDGILIRPVKAFAATRLADVVGCAGYRGAPRTLAQIDVAVSDTMRTQWSE